MSFEDDIRQTKFRSAHQKAALNILYTANWLQGLQNGFFKARGITSSQFNILRILRGQHPGKISLAEIKGRMLDQNSDVSRLVDRLLSKKMISKSQCPDDKRAADISITEKGLTLLSEIDPAVDSLDSVLHALSAKEANTLSALLDKGRQQQKK
jgi:DNA-binding MarR family transcriptional regulator